MGQALCGPAVGVTNETKNRRPNDPSAPQEWSQKLQDQKKPNQIDGKNPDEAIATELFGNPPARRCNELRPRDRNIRKRDRSGDYCRFADGTYGFVCALRGGAKR